MTPSCEVYPRYLKPGLTPFDPLELAWMGPRAFGWPSMRQSIA
jgi:hypothetical protein